MYVSACVLINFMCVAVLQCDVTNSSLAFHVTGAGLCFNQCVYLVAKLERNDVYEYMHYRKRPYRLDVN